jgi:hypothetical protein
MERTGPSARDDLSEFEASETRPLMPRSGRTLTALAERAGPASRSPICRSGRLRIVIRDRTNLAQVRPVIVPYAAISGSDPERLGMGLALAYSPSLEATGWQVRVVETACRARRMAAARWLRVLARMAAAMGITVVVEIGHQPKRAAW